MLSDIVQMICDATIEYDEQYKDKRPVTYRLILSSNDS